MPTTSEYTIRADELKALDMFTHNSILVIARSTKSGPKNTTVTYSRRAEIDDVCDTPIEHLAFDVNTKNTQFPNDTYVNVMRVEPTEQELHDEKVKRHFEREEFYATRIMEKLFGLDAEHDELKVEAEEKLHDNTVQYFIDRYAEDFAEREVKIEWWTRFSKAAAFQTKDERDEPSEYVGTWGLDILRLLHDYTEEQVKEFMRTKADDGWSGSGYRNVLARQKHEVHRQMVGDYFTNELARYALHMIDERKELGL